jgi:hypothetical protein
VQKANGGTEVERTVYSAKFSFEPVIGEIYHLYRDAAGVNFLSLISPLEWNREHIGTFKLNSDKSNGVLKQGVSALLKAG